MLGKHCPKITIFGVSANYGESEKIARGFFAFFEICCKTYENAFLSVN
jgi:hypothetical protein